MTHMLKFSDVTWHENFLIWNNPIDFFILDRIQNWFLAQRWNLNSDTTYFKTAWDFHTSDMIFQCIHQTKSSLTYQMLTLFSKEHAISGSNPDNLVCEWDLLQKMTQIVWVIWPTFNLAWDEWTKYIDTLYQIVICVNSKCYDVSVFPSVNWGDIDMLW